MKEKQKNADAMGIYKYIKVYRMHCVSVGINDDTGLLSHARTSARRIVVCVPSRLRLP
jgi:hypothetical protein